MSENLNITLGLVDDHNMFREAISRFLEEENNLEVVLQAESAEDFLEKINPKIPPDIAIIDINMKGMLGYELAKKLTAKYPKIKLIALSMNAEEMSIIRMIRNGARGYVLKGADPDELIQAINVIYSKGYYYNDIMSNAMLNTVKDPSREDLKEVEIIFLEFCCTEMSYSEIADKMNKASSTIDNYRSELFDKLNVSTRIGLVLYAIKNGIYQIESNSIK